MFDDPNVVLHCEKIDKIYPGTKALVLIGFRAAFSLRQDLQ